MKTDLTETTKRIPHITAREQRQPIFTGNGRGVERFSYFSWQTNEKGER